MTRDRSSLALMTGAFWGARALVDDEAGSNDWALGGKRHDSASAVDDVSNEAKVSDPFSGRGVKRLLRLIRCGRLFSAPTQIAPGSSVAVTRGSLTVRSMVPPKICRYVILM